ncbi:GNAT family N-acetyltransferase [Nocardioides sp. W3-2-3]|nr:GNAT family N-acetyltransferase [Nocardioides convexus]
MSLGWVFAPSYAGRGFATEAARALVDLAFTSYPLHRLMAQARPAQHPLGAAVRAARDDARGAHPRGLPGPRGRVERHSRLRAAAPRVGGGAGRLALALDGHGAVAEADLVAREQGARATGGQRLGHAAAHDVGAVGRAAVHHHEGAVGCHLELGVRLGQ